MKVNFENLSGGDYPKLLELKEDRRLLLEPLSACDEDALLGFYRSLSPEVRLRLRQDNTNRKILKRFLEEIELGGLILLGAVVPGAEPKEIVGEVTLRILHHGWARHVGEIRYCLNHEKAPPDLGGMLIREIVEIAAAQGLDKLTYQVLDDQIRLRALLKNLGFTEEAVLRDHATDLTGKKHDVYIMSNYMAELWRKMEDMIMDREFPSSH
ncbi:MAG: GNAT family protein [Polyangia bacterium]|jgi:RimJ/RimL family protein N-acetyltransferase|nr:GNAT family protein [Polyangia bacterium]